MRSNQQPAPDTSSTLVPTREAAAYLGVAVRTFYGILARGELPFIRVSPRRVCIDVRDLDRYIEQKRETR